MSDEKIDVDELIHLVGEAVVNDENIRGVQWSAISVSAIISQSSADMNGFTYDDEGEFEPNTPGDIRVRDHLRSLQKAMNKKNGGDPWKACLIQIVKEDMSIKMDFEYENAERWKVTPKNRLELISLIKP